MTTPAADGPVWRDRGAIIAQQQTRIAELEAEVKRWKNAGPALWEEAERAELLAEVARLSEQVSALDVQLDHFTAWHPGSAVGASRLMAAEAELAALRGRIGALLTRWAKAEPVKGFPGYDEAYHDAEGDLRAALAVAPAEDTTPAAPHAQDGPDLDGSRCWKGREGCACRDGRPAPVADPSGDTEGGQA